MASLKTKFITNLVVVRNELDVKKSDLAAVRDQLAALFYGVKKGEKEKKEVA